MRDEGAPTPTDRRSGRDGGISSALDTAFDLLANRRRRYVLYCLRDRDGAVGIEDLADRIASWEAGGDRREVLVDLSQSQLPRLAQAGVVGVDRDAGEVWLAEDAGTPLTEYLEVAADEENVA